MRGKRSKQYRKLMQQYALTFSFREPYQVLVDAQMIQDTYRFKMELAPALTRTLHGEVKPMITQCSIRHLFALQTGLSSAETPSVTQQEKTAMLDISRSFTLRRCNHHTLPEPLSTLECYQSVIDPNDQATNKHRYVLAAQDESVRAWARGVKGVPMIYVKRSVMVMEPMAHASAGIREREEKGKLRAGIKKIASTAGPLGKRKRDADVDAGEGDEAGATTEVKRKKVYGAKGANPLSMKKKKVRPTGDTASRAEDLPMTDDLQDTVTEAATSDGRKKRRRKHKSGNETEDKTVVSIEPSSMLLETG